MSDNWSLEGKEEHLKRPVGSATVEIITGFESRHIETLREKIIEIIDEFVIEMRHYDSYDPEKIDKDDITTKILELKTKIKKKFGVKK